MPQRLHLAERLNATTGDRGAISRLHVQVCVSCKFDLSDLLTRAHAMQTGTCKLCTVSRAAR